MYIHSGFRRNVLFSPNVDDPYTYWKIPDSGGYNWVAFDLETKYTLTGVRISGW